MTPEKKKSKLCEVEIDYFVYVCLTESCWTNQQRPAPKHNTCWSMLINTQGVQDIVIIAVRNI